MARPAIPPMTPPAIVPGGVDFDAAELGLGQAVELAIADAETRCTVFVVGTALEIVTLVTLGVTVARVAEDSPVAVGDVSAALVPLLWGRLIAPKVKMAVDEGKEGSPGLIVLVAAPWRIVWVTVTVPGAAHESTASFVQ